MSWQLQTLEALASNPSVDIAQAEKRGLEVSHFLSQAPTDFLEPLMGSPFGRVYKLFLERCCTQNFSGSEAENHRNALTQRLRQVGCETPEGWAVLLALFPLFPPDQLKVEDAAAKLPSWLHVLYSGRYEAAQLPATPPRPEGQTAFEDRIFLNRILGLSNLYYIDPDGEVFKQKFFNDELILGIGRDDLVDNSNLILVIGSGPWRRVEYRRKVLTPTKLNGTKQQADHSATAAQDGGIQRFAALLLFNQPGSVRLADPDSNTRLVQRWLQAL